MAGVRKYNRSQMWEFYRIRTEKFMVVLRCIDAVPRDPRILIIGPRNEAELLLLSLYGFPLRRMVAVDLFSYSPLIRCMDMHQFDFPDDSFDIVYSAWTLKCSRARSTQGMCRDRSRRQTRRARGHRVFPYGSGHSGGRRTACRRP